MIALVGNNDGPLMLLQSMQKAHTRPVCVGLQKPVNDDLKAEYLQHVSSEQLLIGFDEAQLAGYLSGFEVKLLVNCFCNFKFTELLDTYETLNVHLAPLPRYRGRHPLPWALIKGEKRFGVSIHRMTAAIDAGDILWQRTVAIEPGTSVAELRTQLMDELGTGFGNFVRQYQQGTLVSQPNREEEATYVARRYPEDSELTEWHHRDTVYRKVMALRSEVHPAFIRIGGQPVVVKQAELSTRYYEGLAAPFVSRLLSDGIEVVCADGYSVILRHFVPQHHGFRLNQRLTRT